MSSARAWLARSLAVALALVARSAHAQQGDYFSKPLRFLFFDFLILSFPFTGSAALMLLVEPNWRDRPMYWWRRRVLKERARRWFFRRALLLGALGALSVSGLALLLAHLARVGLKRWSAEEPSNATFAFA